MSIDRAVMALAGAFILASVALGYWVSPYWFLLTVFVGANLLQASFTRFCPSALIFKWLGLRPGNVFN